MKVVAIVALVVVLAGCTVLQKAVSGGAAGGIGGFLLLVRSAPGSAAPGVRSSRRWCCRNMPQALARSLPPLRPRLIDVAVLSKFFAAGASLATRSIGYARTADLIFADELTAERIVRLFSSSASKRWREDCALIVLAGSVAEYHASPQTWRPEPSATLARGLVGGDFARVSDAAAAPMANASLSNQRFATNLAAA